VIALMICPLEFLQTAACVEKASRIAVSKLTLQNPVASLDQTALTRCSFEDQAVWCSKETRLMLAAREATARMTPLWTA
jgi:hypothetical protein